MFTRKLVAGILFLAFSIMPLFGEGAPFKFIYERPVKMVSQEDISSGKVSTEGYESRSSRSKSGYVWLVKREEVKDEKHLLQLFGANKGGVFGWGLSSGQKALLNAYRYAQENKKEFDWKWQYCGNSKDRTVEVTLADTGAFSQGGVKKKYGADLKRDFWPHASGNKILLGSSFYNSPLSSGSAQSTLVHEFAHVLDDSNRENNSYGKDGIHSSNEKTQPISAWVEGWAIYNEMLASKWVVVETGLSNITMKEEDKDKAGKYHHFLPAFSKQDLTKVESVNAKILYRITKELSNGKQKVFDTFKRTGNNPDRDLSVFLKDFVKNYPQDAKKVARILDDETLGKMSNQRMEEYLGDTAEVKSYIKKNRNLWYNVRKLGNFIADIGKKAGKAISAWGKAFASGISSIAQKARDWWPPWKKKPAKEKNEATVKPDAPETEASRDPGTSANTASSTAAEGMLGNILGND